MAAHYRALSVDTLIAATKAGELDRFLAASAEAPASIEGRGIPKTKKAA